MKNYMIALLLPSLFVGVNEILAQPPAPTLSEQTLRDADRDRGSSRSLYDQGGGFNVIQLIHNANLRGNTTPEQFQQRQDESLDSAIDSLRRQRSSELNINFSGGSSK
jgi:hypothetical protein